MILSGSLFLAACQFSPVTASKRVSSIDERFRYQQGQRRSETSEAVLIYRKGLGPTLSTHCKWYPSDSRYAELAQRKCGRLQGGVMAFSRFLYEEDAARMGYPVMVDQGHLEFVDFPNECWL